MRIDREWFKRSVREVARYIDRDLIEEDKELFFKVKREQFFTADFWKMRLIAMASQLSEKNYLEDTDDGFNAYDLVNLFDMDVTKVSDLCNLVAVGVEHPCTRLRVLLFFNYAEFDGYCYVTDISHIK